MNRKDISILVHTLALFVLTIGLYMHFTYQTVTVNFSRIRTGKGVTSNGTSIIVLAFAFYVIGIFAILLDKKKSKNK